MLESKEGRLGNPESGLDSESVRLVKEILKYGFPEGELLSKDQVKQYSREFRDFSLIPRKMTVIKANQIILFDIKSKNKKLDISAINEESLYKAYD